MKITNKYMTAVTVASLLAMVLPMTAKAVSVPAPVQTRLQNAEVNRDYRNEQMKRASSSTRPIIMASSSLVRVKQAPINEVRATNSTMPKWLLSPMSPWREKPEMASSSNRLKEVFSKFATSTEFKGRENWKETKLDKFAFLQSKLVLELNKTLEQLKTVRAKLVDRMTKAEQGGRTMTNARGFLAIADQKIALAETAINEVVSFVPPAVSTAKTTASESTSVTLEKPREIGKTAIEALKEAKKALNDAIISIAHSMGLKTSEDINGKSATSTTATTTDR